MKMGITALLAIHGLIHGMGFVGTWGLAEFRGVSRVPTHLIHARPEDGVVRVLAVVWLVALVLFVAAAVLLVGDRGAWRIMAVAATAISMLPIALWWAEAPMGAVANALVLVAVWLAPRLEGVPT